MQQSPDLELLAPVELNLVCSRYAAVPADMEIDAVNVEVLMRLQEAGIAVPSSTVINGAYAIEVANTNHRSRREDFALLVESVSRLGAEVVGGG